MRFAYADPPYLGVAEKLYGHLHPDAAAYDQPETHRALIARLVDEFDGWALSLSVPSLRTILPMTPDDSRVCAWVKPWARMQPGARLQFTWEPVIIAPLRRPSRSVRDWVSANATMQRGMPGAKPDDFAFWMFAAAGLMADDDLHDLFPGSGAVTAAWERYRAQPALTLPSTRRSQRKDALELGLA